MTIYAFRIGPKFPDMPRMQTLTEFKNKKELAAETARLAALGNSAYIDTTSASRAHAWVRRGEIHETALWFDGQRIRRASDGI